jgi:DNA transposition AAA+ family ATPase
VLSRFPAGEPSAPGDISYPINKKDTVALAHIKDLHEWLDGKRKSRRSCRILGESRTGKTVACEAYVKRNQQSKQPQEKQTKNQIPIEPVIMITPPQKCGGKEFFREITECVGFRAVKGTISELRSRAMDEESVLKEIAKEYSSRLGKLPRNDY